MSNFKQVLNSSEESTKRQHVLVVDDDLIAREVVRDALEESGFDVSVAENGERGLEQFERENPDLILLDVEMPALNGFDTCRRLRALPGGENLPVIMMTGRDDNEAVELAFGVEATDFVVKPFNLLVLIQRIRYLLRAAKTLIELEQGQQRLLSAQKMANLGYWDWDLVSDSLLLSAEAYKILGYPVGVLKNIADYSNVIYEKDRPRVLAELGEKRPMREAWLLEYRVVTADGEIRTIKSTGETTFAISDHSPTWLMGTLQDITEQRRSEETIRRMAFYDDVTGLHNRVAFMEELNLLINLHRRLETPLAVLYLDLDDFKRVNDSLGHHVGDALLKEFATRLNNGLRVSDLQARHKGSTAFARLGGDEFTVLLSGLKHQTDAAIVARRIQESLSSSFTVPASAKAAETKSHEVYVGASIGIAVYPNDGDDAGELLKNADTAMYAAKRAGKATYRFYVDEMNDRALANLAMETQLRGAMDRNELTLCYQPQIDLASGEIVGVEALARWENPELGNISPGDFIPLAEDTGQIITLGTWVLETACKQLKQWQGDGLHDLKVAVNVSGLQFRQDKFEDLVANILDATGLEAKGLELELTESMLMRDVDQSIDTMHALKAMGVAISIDDFGTGYSSLSYLRRFPIDTLKIDRSFVNGLGADANSTGITNAIIAMAHNLGFTVVAEGIEDQDQLALLQAKRCEIGQGFLFSKPVLGEKIPELVTSLDRRKALVVDG